MVKYMEKRKNYYTIPSDFRTETIDKYYILNKKDYNGYLKETYGQMTTGEITTSGRPIQLLPAVSNRVLEEYVGYSKEKGIDFNYTFNSACMGNEEYLMEGKIKIVRFIKSLIEIGINTFTVASPAVIDIIREIDSEAKIVVSTISEVNNISKLKFYKKLMVNRIVVDADINRKMHLLREMSSEFGEGIEVIVNNVCFHDCPLKKFHYNHDAHTLFDSIEDNYFTKKCFEQKYEEPENLLKTNFVRPEDIKLYNNLGIHYFKIQGRTNILRGNPVKTLEAYMRNYYKGNLLDLLMLFMPRFNDIVVNNELLEGFIDFFGKNKVACEGNCSRCGHCKAFANKAINVQAFEKEAKRMRQLFNME